MIILPGASTWRLVVAFLLIICGILALCCVPRAITKYVAWLLTGSADFCRDTKYMRLGIIVGLVVAVGGSIGLVRLMLPELTRLMWYEMHHPGAISHRTKIADKTQLVMFVASNVSMYMKGGSIGKRPWKWPLLVLIVLGPVGIDLNFPGYFMPMMLFLGLVWLLSGGVTLYSYLRHTTKRPALETA
jgi:hypothetical protein